MKHFFTLISAVGMMVGLMGCAHSLAYSDATNIRTSTDKKLVVNEEIDHAKIVERLEKEKNALELQNAILLKALNERKQVVRKLPKGEVVQQFPEFEELIFDQAKTAYKEKDEERLQEAIRIMRANRPNSQTLESMFFWLAKLQEIKDLNSQALVTYDEFIKLFPDSRYVPQALFLKGKLYEKLNLKPQAMKIYADIRRLHPDSRESHLAIAKLEENAPERSVKHRTKRPTKHKTKEVKRK
jgi:TolA-binding protein